MPRYFFDDGAPGGDRQGQDCADMHDARNFASGLAVKFIESRRGGNWTVNVLDKDGQCLFEIAVANSLTSIGRQVIWLESEKKLLSGRPNTGVNEST